MSTITTIIHVIASIVLIIAVLFQVGKGASIGSTFGGASSQTLFGSSGPATFLAKITTACAVIFMLTSLYLTYISSQRRTESIMSEVPAVKTEPAPAAPATPSTPQAPSQGALPHEGEARKPAGG